MKQCPSCRASIVPQALACQFCGFSYAAQHATAAAQVAQQRFNPNLVPCRACKSSIAKRADRCPTCGAVQRASFPLKSLLLLGVIVVVAFGVVGAQKKKEQERAEVTTAEAIDISARELQADYDANEVAADERYKNKILRITGTIESINKDILDDPYVVLRTGDFKGVHCHFNSSDGLQSLRKGKQIAVRCRADGYIIGSPVAKDCILN
jgi:hypothetical protein